MMPLLAIYRASEAAPPRVADDRYKLELVASEPDIVTPIGLAFDRQGRLLIVESHTHERPDEYDGPAGDRIRMLADSDGDGRLDRWSTFAAGFRHAMNVLVRPDGAAYLVTRHNVVLLRDTDKDGVADNNEVLLRLETEDAYPHNGLSGIAQLANGGDLLIGLGENHGIPYRLIGSEGAAITGKDGAGTIFRCSDQGRGLERLATGFWNPFSICVLPDGRIFIVDNDPDASPPCRLLNVREGGDYGHRFQYGRAGNHPLQAWNGELPGTLPMVCGTGEAPTAIVPHAGSLWVTSWGDHRIERYQLVPRGASYDAQREVVVQGDANFRPTGMAVAPDGSLYFGDWVLRDYPVHGKGRVWRLVLPDNQRSSIPSVIAEVNTDASSPRDKLGLLVDQRWKGADDAEPILTEALNDESADVRLFAVRWIADERISGLRDDVVELLNGPQPSPRYYLAVLAAIDWLDHEPSLRGAGISDELLVRELRNDRRSAEIHALALRLLSPDHQFVTLDRLRDYLRSPHLPLRLEAVRSLAQQSNPDRFDLLSEVAGDVAQDVEVRAEAIVGLAADAEKHRHLVESLAASDVRILRDEAQRALRLAGLRSTPSETKPPADDLTAWNALLRDSGNPVAGGRLFFYPVGPRCGICHQHHGRGGRSGPDLTTIAASSSRERIIASILQPSQEIAPHYQPWVLITADGKTHTGLRLPKGGDNGMEEYFDSAGNVFSLPSESIELRQASGTSIMPDGLQATLSIDDLRDLMTFLHTN
ncbi:MAG: PVC-type heme-binding CxxCH protein [Pirellulales bacterium]